MSQTGGRVRLQFFFWIYPTIVKALSSPIVESSFVGVYLCRQCRLSFNCVSLGSASIEMNERVKICRTPLWPNDEQDLPVFLVNRHHQFPKQALEELFVVKVKWSDASMNRVLAGHVLAVGFYHLPFVDLAGFFFKFSFRGFLAFIPHCLFLFLFIFHSLLIFLSFYDLSLYQIWLFAYLWRHGLSSWKKKQHANSTLSKDFFFLRHSFWL